MEVSNNGKNSNENKYVSLTNFCYAVDIVKLLLILKTLNNNNGKFEEVTVLKDDKGITMIN
jgi:hypothetical protein